MKVGIKISSDVDGSNDAAILLFKQEIDNLFVRFHETTDLVEDAEYKSKCLQIKEGRFYVSWDLF